MRAIRGVRYMASPGFTVCVEPGLWHEGTTTLFERGLEIMEVQQMTGHKTLKILLAYTHMDPSRLVDRHSAAVHRVATITREC